jgi:hypothetical protein
MNTIGTGQFEHAEFALATEAASSLLASDATHDTTSAHCTSSSGRAAHSCALSSVMASSEGILHFVAVQFAKHVLNSNERCHDGRVRLSTHSIQYAAMVALFPGLNSYGWKSSSTWTIVVSPGIANTPEANCACHCLHPGQRGIPYLVTRTSGWGLEGASRELAASCTSSSQLAIMLSYKL